MERIVAGLDADGGVPSERPDRGRAWA